MYKIVVSKTVFVSSFVDKRGKSMTVCKEVNLETLICTGLYFLEDI